MINFLYKWLPIVFGCHCRDDRSFYFKGKKFPICSRCTGELLGILVYPIFGFFFDISVKLSLIIMLPMIIDGFVQLLTKYESTNIRRFITGFLFGFSLMKMFVYTTSIAFNFGYNLVK